MTRHYTREISVSTRGRGFTEVTSQVVSWIREQKVSTGLLTVFIQHTSASLVVQENADPDVKRDMETFFRDLVKDGNPKFYHVLEGPDDMSAHIRSALTNTSLSIPVISGRPALGTWQGIYVYEHRARGQVVPLHGLRTRQRLLELERGARRGGQQLASLRQISCAEGSAERRRCLRRSRIACTAAAQEQRRRREHCYAAQRHSRHLRGPAGGEQFRRNARKGRAAPGSSLC